MRYGQFAYIFDDLMSDVAYIKWVDYLEDIFEKYGIKPSLVLDLACGTGNITIECAKRGYEMIGVDISPEMLSVARQKTLEQELDILFLNQDMTDFELYGTVDAIFCCMDGINYITEKKRLARMFKLVNNYLNNGGLFIFDIRSEYGIESLIGNNTFIEDAEDITYIWENNYDLRKKICDMRLTFFKREGEMYSKFYENHRLKAFNPNEIIKLLEAERLKLLGSFDNFSFKKPRGKAERIFFVAKKK